MLIEDGQLIDKTAEYVRQTLQGAEAGHDWWHIQRVWNNAKLIGRQEAVDMLVVELAALLHDIADSKFYGGDEEIGPEMAGLFLRSIDTDAAIVEHVQQIIRNMSFKASFEKLSFTSPELQVVQDADRLDAIGAIGIARAFTYGGFKNREMHNPDIAPNLNMSKEEYKNTSAPTINHFHEKLLLLKDRMNTSTGKMIAQQRHAFMEQYLEQFYAEWEGLK
ncbi:HD domain-containing protein [Mucilaginibacter paludis]|uniref:Metal dependent phosphohydrolase n=1 Tax=Mucilaginibacter paludis DSM 18603 TaxID=714943 RepID=H1XZY3_9SPHI|nr:HD domain-containing protein [Mucilaginibacter paludis]EHQ27825.1 metal dependent phosphohydrolase [Mucilaginibacter paludis DSM 18603]